MNVQLRIRNVASALGLLAVAATLIVVVPVFREHRAYMRAILFDAPREGELAAGPAGRKKTTRFAPGQIMTLDPSGGFLMNSITNRPVFLTGESAWSLQVQLSDEDARVYLDDRKSRGFNAIWVGLADNTYSDHPPADYYGNVPFNGPDFANENPAYWSRVDATLLAAAERGITVLASPAFVGYGCKDGYCESYRRSPAEVLRRYGEFLGNRYKGHSNIIWVIGGDANPLDSDVQSKLHALAMGVRSTDPVHLMTSESYRGVSSFDVWSRTPWLDLDGLYLLPKDIPAKAHEAYLRGHPVFLFEDLYEDYKTLTATDLRAEGYWAVLSGCTLGRVFGNIAIWNFSARRETTLPWKPQLASEGSIGQEWLGKLFRSREHWKLVPDIDHRVMTAGYDPRAAYGRGREALRSLVRGLPERAPDTLSVAARTSDGRTIIAYLAAGGPTVSIDMNRISDPSAQARAWWFNPRNGSSTMTGTFPTTGSARFTPPTAEDWVLVIDSLAAGWGAPGTASPLR